MTRTRHAKDIGASEGYRPVRRISANAKDIGDIEGYFYIAKDIGVSPKSCPTPYLQILKHVLCLMKKRGHSPFPKYKNRLIPCGRFLIKERAQSGGVTDGPGLVI